MTSALPVLAPYRSGRAGRRIKPWSLLFVGLYSIATGAAVALLPAQLLVLLAIPLFVAVGVILWLLPDGPAAPRRLLVFLLAGFLVTTTLWPSYISIDLPGLPWINPVRIVAFGLLAVGLYSFSTSSAMRGDIAQAMRATPVLRIAFWIFWLTTLITLVFASGIAMSLNKWMNNQIFWTFMFLMAVWIGTKPGSINPIIKVLNWATILVSLETIYEFHIGQVPWLDHIPAFMTVDVNYLTNVLKAQGRAGTDIYRAHGTFSVALICAEYLAVVYPFLIHALLTARGLVPRLLLSLGLLATLAAIWFTNARSGMIGFFMSVFLYGGFAAIRYWRRNRQSLVGVSTLAMMLVAAATFFVLALTWQRLHNMTFGGAQHQPSSEAREVQWAMGWPKIRENPIGHGAAQNGQVLGYTNLGGQLTIDSYYLSLLLDYGVAGFAAFLTIFGAQAVYGLRTYFAAEPGEEDLAGPITIALLNFLVIKAVLSSEFNMPLAFILLGFLIAIAWRQQQRVPGLPARAGSRETRSAGAMVPA